MCALVAREERFTKLLLSKAALEMNTKPWHFYDQPLFGVLCLKVIGNPFRFLQAVVHFLPKKSPFFDPFNRIVFTPSICYVIHIYSIFLYIYIFNLFKY